MRDGSYRPKENPSSVGCAVWFSYLVDLLKALMVSENEEVHAE